MTDPAPIRDLLAAIESPAELTRDEWVKKHQSAEEDLRKVEKAESAERDLRTVPAEFGWVLRPNWQKLLIDRTKFSKDAVERIRAAIHSTGDVLVRGPSGYGKTSLAVAILRRRIASGARGRFVSSVELSQAHAQQERADKAWKFMQAAQATPLVLLDDIGFELAGNKPSAVCDLVYHRRTGLANIWTTAFSDEQLSQHYGDGIRRRLTETGRVTVVEIG
jgi:DNA replication protein DnaC